MRILVACEESGIVRDAFSQRGHDAWSCDILPRKGKHISADVLTILNDGWDMMIAFPPCTHLAVSGAKHFERKRRLGLQQAAIAFVIALWNAPIDRIGIENPVGVLSTQWRQPDQIIQPWQFGHGETKATCLWLKNLPPLVPTNVVEGREQRIWKMPPGPKRARLRSQTFAGIAQAMADQWSSLIEQEAA